MNFRENVKVFPLNCRVIVRKPLHKVVPRLIKCRFVVEAVEKCLLSWLLSEEIFTYKKPHPKLLKSRVLGNMERLFSTELFRCFRVYIGEKLFANRQLCKFHVLG